MADYKKGDLVVAGNDQRGDVPVVYLYEKPFTSPDGEVYHQCHAINARHVGLIPDTELSPLGGRRYWSTTRGDIYELVDMAPGEAPSMWLAARSNAPDAAKRLAELMQAGFETVAAEPGKAAA